MERKELNKNRNPVRVVYHDGNLRRIVNPSVKGNDEAKIVFYYNCEIKPTFI
jgi:hypothetical protein